MRTITILALVTVLSGCNSAEKELLASTRAELKDPNSAEFSQLELKKTSDGTVTILCGMVNAKNSYGGYVGARPFTATRWKDEKDVLVDFSETADCKTMLEVVEKVVSERKKS